MFYKTLLNKSDPKEVRKHEDRLRQRLKQFGYSMSKRVTTTPTNRIQLIRAPRTRGYQIRRLDTGVAELGASYDLTLNEVEAFWQAKWDEQQKEKRKEKAAKQREINKNGNKTGLSWD